MPETFNSFLKNIYISATEKIKNFFSKRKTPIRIIGNIIFSVFIVYTIFNYSEITEKFIPNTLKFINTHTWESAVALFILLTMLLFFKKYFALSAQRLFSSLTNKYFMLSLAGLAIIGASAALFIPSYTNWFRENDSAKSQQTISSPQPTQSGQNTGNQQKQESKNSASELRGHLLYITGGVVAVLGLIETNRKNSQDHIRQVHAARRDRYIQAVDKLSSKDAPVRLGGMYALIGLADEWIEDDNLNRETRIKEGQVIINNLCSYIRSPFPLADKFTLYEKHALSVPPPMIRRKKKIYSPELLQKSNKDEITFKEEREIRLAIIQEIRSRLNGGLDSTNKPNPGPWSKFTYDFSGDFFYPVDLSNSYFEAPINFRLSNFFESVNFSSTFLNDDADFMESSFRENTLFENSIFNADVRFRGAVFTEGTDFSQVTFKGSTDFSKSIFNGGVLFLATFCGYATFSETTFSQDIQFTGITFHQEVDFSKSTFKEPSIFKGVFFKGKTHFDDVTFAKSVNFSEATFAKSVNFSEATFAHEVSFYRATFTRDADFRRIFFTRDANFCWAVFAQTVDFREVTFTRKASFSYATFTGKAFFSDAAFTSEASFSYAAFTSEAFFSDAAFTSEASFSGTAFTHDVFFSGATFAQKASFSGATFAQKAYFSGATFIQKLSFKDAFFKRSAPTFMDEILRARFSVHTAQQDYNFSVRSGSEPIPPGDAELDGVKHQIPVGTVLFDPDSGHISEPAKPIDKFDNQGETSSK